jgi:Na+/H+ antiporter NhaD/arsenite permease-like protein
MAAVLGLEHAHLFDAMATRLVGRFRTQRAVSLAMVLLTGFLATFVSNDVALISLVPLMLVVAGRAGFNALWPVVLQTLAANIGSTLTPMGNPQNLYLFSHYHLTPLQLVLAALPFVVSGVLVVAGLGFALIPATPITFSLSGSEPPTRHGHRRAVIYGSLFLSGVAGVFHWLPVWGVAGVALLTLFVLDRALLRKLDVFLLLTFVCFFVAIGNLTHMPVINTVANHMVASTRGAYLAGFSCHRASAMSPPPCCLPRSPHTGGRYSWG